MIITSVPTRVSLASMDHEPFSERHGGVALNFCINKRIYIILRKRTSLEKFKFRISYSHTQLCNEINEIEHPLVREALKMSGLNRPLEIIYAADLPAQLGLATSSAMSLALLKTLYFYQNVGLSNEILSRKAYELERLRAGELGGFQDFYCNFGGISYLQGSCDNVYRQAVPMSPEKVKLFQDHLILVYTGKQQNSSDVLQDQIEKIRRRETLDECFELKNIVQKMHSVMVSENFFPLQLSKLMRDSWELKKKLSSSMSSPQIQGMEERILDVYPEAGIRLVGSGGGRGFLLVLAPPELHENLKLALCEWKTSKVCIDWEGIQTRMIRTDECK